MGQQEIIDLLKERREVRGEKDFYSVRELCRMIRHEYPNASAYYHNVSVCCWSLVRSGILEKGYEGNPLNNWYVGFRFVLPKENGRVKLSRKDE